MDAIAVAECDHRLHPLNPYPRSSENLPNFQLQRGCRPWAADTLQLDEPSYGDADGIWTIQAGFRLLPSAGNDDVSVTTKERSSPMLRLPGEDETFPTPCVIRAPKGAETVEHEIAVHFRVLPADEFRALSRQGDEPLLQRLIADWEGVHGTEGEPMPCTQENIRLWAGMPYFVLGVVGGYEERFAPVKNFRAPHAS